MTRYAVFDKITGRMHTDTLREPTGLPDHLDYKEIPDHDAGIMWDDETRSMIERPPKILENTERDGFWRLQQDPRFKSLSSAQKTRIIELLETHFGHARY